MPRKAGGNVISYKNYWRPGKYEVNITTSPIKHCSANARDTKPRKRRCAVTSSCKSNKTLFSECPGYKASKEKVCGNVLL